MRKVARKHVGRPDFESKWKCCQGLKSSSFTDMSARIVFLFFLLWDRGRYLPPISRLHLSVRPDLALRSLSFVWCVGAGERVGLLEAAKGLCIILYSTVLY